MSEERRRNNRLANRGSANHYCLRQRLSESMLRAQASKIVFTQPGSTTEVSRGPGNVCFRGQSRSRFRATGGLLLARRRHTDRTNEVRSRLTQCNLRTKENPLSCSRGLLSAQTLLALLLVTLRPWQLMLPHFLRIEGFYIY